jgi:hypothetical protein
MQVDGERVRRGALAASVALAVAVRYRRQYDLWHTGLVYRDETGEARLMHLEWDRTLTDTALDDPSVGWDDYYAWVALEVPRESAHAIAQLCRRVALCVAVDPHVRYSVRHHLGRFDEATGRYVPAAGERGLTCATCVLALCRGARVELLQIATWQPREEDRPWIERVVAYLRLSDPAHAADVASDGLCARFRPTEVAGACLAPTLPVAFDDAVKLAETLRARYDEHFPAPPDL